MSIIWLIMFKKTVDEFLTFGTKLKPSDEGYQIAIEKPYLTLKNIGQGTAKNVHVIFSEDGLKETAAILNTDYNDDYDYKIENNTIK